MYDGFTADFGLPTRFFTLLLAPDNKIYCSVSNTNSRYLHVIENPDLPGTACDVRQHAIHLPVFNNNLLPNIPYYRLWEWEDSPCDTLGSVAVQETGDESFGMKVYPNPASDLVILTFDQDVPSSSEVVLLNLAGQAVYRAALPENTGTWQLPLANLPNGCYFIRAQIGTGSHLRKLNIIR